MADELKNLTNATDWLETMPEAIQNWIGSPALTYLIIDLNRKLGFKGEKFTVIPYLIFRIANKELMPEKVIDVLSKELTIDKVRSAMIAEEIKEKMLKPIEAPLRKELGVDINMIDFAQPSPVTPPTPPAPTFQVPSASSTGSLQAGSGQAPPQPTPPTPPTPPEPVTRNQSLETKIPINVIKDGDNKDSWLNRLK